MKKTILMSVFFFLALYQAQAQAGHPKDSIVAAVRSCTDCWNITWSTDSSRMSYAVTGGVIHRFHFNAKRVCIKYEEEYPSGIYAESITDYMDSAYIKLSRNRWRETLYTVHREPIIDMAVYWTMTTLPNGRLLVIAEFGKVK